MAHGTFTGDPEAVWLTERRAPDRGMRLLAPFSFRDPAGKAWAVPVNHVVNGASIPRALWTLVGSPYTGDYRRASIVHDKACDDARGNSRARRAADRMFYHACRAGGCSVAGATLLYIGVRIGALAPSVPAWRQASTSAREGPRLRRTAAEERLEADFRLVADRVLEEGETDDPREIERRTDRALTLVTGVRVRGASRRRPRRR
jgi:hypothetical protein